MYPPTPHKMYGIIKNVLSKHFEEELSTDIGDSKFSLIIDESTDISVTKFLGIAIRYYSRKREKIVSTFLKLAELDAGNAPAIVEAIEQVITEFGLDMKNLIGIGTYNASVMVGVKNGVIALLRSKYKLPSLVLLRCVCHSLQLAVSAATRETLPRNLDYLIRETYNWFSHSSLRQKAYSALYKLINDDKEPLKILPLCDTRWLAIKRALERILEQWIELETHFEIVRRSESSYSAEVLYNNYKDPANKVYLTYVYSVVSEVDKTNKIFEAQSADPLKVLDDLQNLVKSIASKIILPTAKINVFTDDVSKHLDPNPYLGFAFEKSSNSLLCDSATKNSIKQRCINFTTKLVSELQNRLPSNLVLLTKLKLLHPSEALKHRLHKLSIIKLIQEFTSDERTITRIEQQWNDLTNYQWENVRASEEFWIEVDRYRDSCGENPFKDLVDFALSLLSLPLSNAEIERIFSQLNLIKTKLRNRLKARTTNAILAVRYGLKRAGQCCFQYELPENYLHQIGTQKVYDNKRTNEENAQQLTTEESEDVTEILTLLQTFED